MRNSLPWCAVILVACGSAHALPTVRKYPVGPWVINDAGTYSVPAGQPIDWLVRVCNDTTAPLTAQVSDFVHSGDCLNHEYLTLTCPPVQDAGGLLTACDDSGLGMIDLSNIVIPVNTCAEVVMRTTVDLLTPQGLPGGVCNVAFYQTDSGTPDGSGQTSPPTGNSGCSCVEVLAPIPTQLGFTLTPIPDDPPLLAADPTSTLVYELNAANLTPREVRGRVLFPIPAGLDFVEIVDCPPGSTCSYFAGSVDILDIVIPEGGTFSARIRVAPDCGSAANPDLCAQAEFIPIENPGAVIRSDGGLAPGEQPTCIRAAAPDLRINKTWRLVSDADGDGVPTIGDRLRYVIEVWNAGDGAAHAVDVVDNLPLGLDATSAAADATGFFDPSRRQGVWTIGDLGPGSVADLWLEANISGSSIAPNRARLTTDVSRACSLAVVLSDDPTIAGASDATTVSSAPAPSLRVAKSWTFTDVDGDGGVTAGEPIHWTVEVVNRGAGTARDARLDDALGACWGDLTTVAIEPPGAGVDASTPRALAVTGLGGPDGLVPDEAVRVTFTLTSSDVATCCNEAVASWNAGAQAVTSTNPGALAGADGPSCLSPAEPAVWMTKSVSLSDTSGNGLAEPGERLTYTIMAGSAGGGVSDVILTDELPGGIAIDPASIVTNPPSLGVTLVPAPAGAHGNGRLEVRQVGLSVGGDISVTFEADIVATVAGTVCNTASLVVIGQGEPFLSSDVLGGDATCIDVVVLDPPALGLSLDVTPVVVAGCLNPGDDVRIQVDYSVSSGGASAAGLDVEVQLPAGFTVTDSGGGLAGGDLIRWPLGSGPAGSTGSFVALGTLACGPVAAESFTAAATATNAAAVSAGPVSLTTAVAGLAGVVDVVHVDANGNGTADPGDLITATLTITETLGCDAEEIVARLDPTAFLDVGTINDGGVLVGGVVEWTIPLIAASGTTTVSVELMASASAPECSFPILTSSLTWALAPPTCRDPVVLPLLDAPGPSVNCLPDLGLDLLREDAVSALQPLTPLLDGILDSTGDDDTCTSGTVTRIAPGRVFQADVGSLLATGVVVADDAQIVGEGSPGVLIFYEVTNSCDLIRVCRVDANGNVLDGRESILVTTGTCP